MYVRQLLTNVLLQSARKGKNHRRNDSMINLYEVTWPSWDLNLQPLNQQSDALPTAVWSPASMKYRRKGHKVTSTHMHRVVYLHIHQSWKSWNTSLITLSLNVQKEIISLQMSPTKQICAFGSCADSEGPDQIARVHSDQGHNRIIGYYRIN